MDVHKLYETLTGEPYPEVDVEEAGTERVPSDPDEPRSFERSSVWSRLMRAVSPRREDARPH